MSIWRQLSHGVRALFDRKTADEDIADEVKQYLDEATEALMASGLTPAEARRAARLEHGDASVIREQVRSYGWENVVEAGATDLRHAARRLRRSPGFTVVAVFTVALGIGASTSILSVLNPILFDALPYPDSDRLVAVTDRSIDGAPVEVTFGTYREVADRGRSFESLAVMRPWRPTLVGEGEPERLDGQQVSAGYFDVLGVTPALGDGFDPADDRVSGRRVVILADGLWRRRFGGDSAIVGRDVRLDGQAFTVAGVMPPGFENVLAPTAQVWSLLQYDASLPSHDGREWGHHLRMLARLRAGVGLAAVRADLDAIARQPVREFARPAWASLDRGLAVAPLRDEVAGPVRPTLLAVLGAVVLLLAIACVNVTHQLLARGVRYRGELAIRTALGAGRGRLMRQLLTESLLLAALGGALGVLLAALGVEALRALAPPGLPRTDAIGIDGTVLGAAVGVTTVVGLIAGLGAALIAPRGDLSVELQLASRRSTGNHLPARRALVVAQVALALVLLVGAGLLLRSLQRLFVVPAGFDPANVLVLQVQTSGERFDDDVATSLFFDQALQAVRGVGGVLSAGLTSQLPLSGDFDRYGVTLTPADEAGADGGAFRYAVSPDYFETLRIPLQRGRLLDASDDRAGAPRAVVINASLAARRFPGRDPIGERVHVGRTDLPAYTIVGIVADVKQASLAVAGEEAVYVPAAQWYFADRARWLVVRTQGDPADLTTAVKQAIWSVDADQPIVRTSTLPHMLAVSEAQRRFALIVFEAFALLALVLAGIGIYGVLAGSVAERTRELGLRAALGASRGNVLGLVIGQGLTMAAAGTVVGLVTAVVTSRLLSSLLFGVSRLDPLTYVGGIAVLTAVTVIACWIPARRAARVDPAITLRME